MAEFRKSGGEYLRSYKDILIYHDYQPLLLFWNISDLVNNRVLWMSYSEALEGDMEWAYVQYCLYFVVALGMLFTLPWLESCVRFVGAYLMLYIFSTTRFVYMVATDEEFSQNPDIARSLIVTGVYFVLWLWIYAKMRVELAHRRVRG